MKISAAAFLLLFFYAGAAFTSKEGVLSLANFQVESAGIASSGPVIVIGKASNGKIDSVKIKAFGKEFEMPKDLLQKIPASANGIQISFEQGYEKLGGRTVYLKFMMGFTSSEKHSASFSVNEAGKFQQL